MESEKLVYIDESGIEEGQTRRYAKSPKGKPAYGFVEGRRGVRHTIIGALNNGKFMAPMIFKGNTDTQVFNIWIKDCLLPVLKPGQTVVMDNASFHKSSQTRELIESKGCTLKFLPTYSPDLNPIEQCWAILKSRLKKFTQPYKTFFSNLCHNLKVLTFKHRD